MVPGSIIVRSSHRLEGTLRLSGAKNAVLVIMASLLLTKGVSTIRNVPAISDVYDMISILESMGVIIDFDADNNILRVDTSKIDQSGLNQEAVSKFRASLLIFGPLLGRFLTTKVAVPGGDAIGSRPLDYHIKNFRKLGAHVDQDQHFLYGQASVLKPAKLVLDYPSVGATENLLMALVQIPGESSIVHAAIEPEVLDLIDVLKKMGAHIEILPPATIRVIGGLPLKPVDHTVIYDRLEAGSLLCAAAMTQGDIFLPDASVQMMDLFLMKLEEMGCDLSIGNDGFGIRVQGPKVINAITFKTCPFPGFPTDLQPLMMAALVKARGKSNVIETVFENRFLHAPEMNKMGASIQAAGHYATISGVDELRGAVVKATDIRASCALALLGCVAQGETQILNGYHHWKRGYETLDQKLRDVGADIILVPDLKS